MLDHHYTLENPAHQRGSLLSKIQSSMLCIGSPVTVLPSKEGITKYSVCDGLLFEFVHVFKTLPDTNLFIKCQSGICQSRNGKKQHYDRLLSGKANLCSHLNTFKLEINNIFQNFQQGDDMVGYKFGLGFISVI